MNLPAPEFFDTDSERIVNECVEYYEGLTGSKLSPGQAEMLLINMIAYREQLILIQANEGCRQNLLSYARYPMLDYLGELVGVTRLTAKKAECTIQFTMVEGHGAFIIPEKIRVQTTDGLIVFETLEEKTVQEADTVILIKAEATTEGEGGNDYKAGDVSIILDPQAFVASAANIAETGGGADQETDDELRERVRIAPNRFSCAGPRSAYEFYAKSAHPAIIDVGITSPVPGQVNIYPLLEDGETPSQEVIDAVFAACNDDMIRPLTDTVVVEAPEVVEYSIVVNVTPLDGAILSATKTLIESNLKAYADERKVRLGVDAVITQIIAESTIKGSVYKVAVASPAADVQVGFNQIASCTGITVNMLTPVNE